MGLKHMCGDGLACEYAADAYDGCPACDALGVTDKPPKLRALGDLDEKSEPLTLGESCRAHARAVVTFSGKALPDGCPMCAPAREKIRSAMAAAKAKAARDAAKVAPAGSDA